MAVLALPFAAVGQAAAQVYDDGGTHWINGPTAWLDYSLAIGVRNSDLGFTTTTNIVDPAAIGTIFISKGGTVVTPSSGDFPVRALATNGGHAVVNLQGGTLEGSVIAEEASCVTISGGSIGPALFENVSVHAGALGCEQTA